MSCNTHAPHDHDHNESCGHTRVQHEDHIGYLHDEHLHCEHDGHYDEHSIDVSGANPDTCHPIECDGSHDQHGCEKVPHGDHWDYLHNGRLHHLHNGHCDDHGPVLIVN